MRNPEEPLRRPKDLINTMNKLKRQRRHITLRKRVVGIEAKPRLAVFRSTQHIYAQIIDDTKNKTLVSASDVKMTGTKKEKAVSVGEKIAEKAKKLKITKIIFDRGGFKYHGRVSALAEGARKGGLEF